MTALAVVVPLAFTSLAQPASAQTDCPPPDAYGGGQPCPRHITIVLDLQFGPAGTRLRIRAHGFNAGDPVTGTFNGAVVFEATAQAGVGQTAMAAPRPFAAAGLAAIRSLFGQTDNSVGGVDQTITVPNLTPAKYPVCVSGSGAQGCGEFTITASGDNTSVLGSNTIRDTGTGTASGGSTSSGTKVLGQSFAKTGIAVGILLLLAVSLIVVGRFLRAASRRRKAHA